MPTAKKKTVIHHTEDRPTLYKVEQYVRKSGSQASQFFKAKGRSYFQKLPGVKSVQAFQGRFGFGAMEYDIEIWWVMVT
jgi:hypothetical protein